MRSTVCAAVNDPSATGNIVVHVTVSLSNTGGLGDVDNDGNAVDATSETRIDVRSAVGFEVLGSDGLWHSTPIVRRPARDGAILLSGSPKGARAIRYLWYMAPCTQQPYQCAVYAAVAPLGRESGEMEWLPLGPFYHSFDGNGTASIQRNIAESKANGRDHTINP